MEKEKQRKKVERKEKRAKWSRWMSFINALICVALLCLPLTVLPLQLTVWCVMLLQLAFWLARRLIDSRQSASRFLAWLVSFLKDGEIVLILLLFLLARRYCLPSGVFWIILLIALVLGAVVGVTYTLRRQWKGRSVAMRSFSLLLFCVLFTAILCIYLLHINLALDLRAPELCEAEIEQKDHLHRRKASDSYSFSLTPPNQDTIKLEVSVSTYVNTRLAISLCSSDTEARLAFRFTSPSERGCPCDHRIPYRSRCAPDAFLQARFGYYFGAVSNLRQPQKNQIGFFL
jgi:hypothetical protein